MWPKMLLELLPHFARLVPAADKYFNTRSSSDRAQEAALAALGEEVRGRIGGVAETQSGIDRQLQAQNAQIAELSVDVTRARIAAEGTEARVAKLEATVEATGKLLWSVAVLLVGVAAMLVVVLMKLKAH
jgi:chromosome segregation ATPase